MRPWPGYIRGMVGALLALASLPGVAAADGGTVRLRERAGGYQVTVFTAPAPLRAGPVDVSVLVQDADTGVPVERAKVEVRATPAGETEPTIRCPATAEAATNKLFRAAQFDVPEAGRWRIDVAVDGPKGPARVGFDVDVAEPLPRWVELWPWIALPVPVVLLFVAHQVLKVRNTEVQRRKGGENHEIHEKHEK